MNLTEKYLKAINMKPKVIVMSGYGVNSEMETKFAFEQSGAEAEIVHINDVIDGMKKLEDFQILVFPGGFAHGDDTGSGNAYANKFRNKLWDDVNKFITQDKLVIGICNGCQVLANLGLIPGLNGEYGERKIGMMHNVKARLECRWVDIKVQSEKCIWTRDIDIVRCPVANGEGRFFMEDDVLAAVKDGDQVAFRYVKPDGSAADGEYPVNPSGSIDDIAAVCDPTGKIMGVMPHAERNLSFYNQNDWTLLKEIARREGKELPEEGSGLKLFANGVKYFN
jgi:phosphoribosylformylglycinamidine synthase subunit PurQ / glutaminase